MRRALPAAALLGVVAILVIPRAAAAQQPAGDFVLIVHRANPVAALPRAQVGRLFLRQVTRWPAGGSVEAVDLPENSPVRAHFTREAHRRSVGAVRAYWQQQIFSGREIPPPIRPTSAEVAAFVAADPKRIGYVAAGTPLPAGVKVVRVE